MSSTAVSSDSFSQSSQFPLLLGDLADFSRVRAFFKKIPFLEEDICSVLDIESLADFHSVKAEQIDWSKSPSLLSSLCIRLFLLSEDLECQELSDHLAPELMQSLFNLDLIRKSNTKDQGICATVLLYPIRDLIIVSDRIDNPLKAETPFSPEIVFPAVHIGTRTFLQIIPDTPAESVLDLCSGTGVAAILARRYANQVVAVDLVSRSNHFARFNCLLNQSQDVEILQSDLFGALEGRSFDRIITHPPYVPALTPIAFYRDGGQTGETLVQRIIQQIPAHLNPGGTFFAVCAGLDTRSGNFEQRVRAWLGGPQEGFDILFARISQSTPQEFLRDLMWAQQHMESSEISRWQEVFNQIGAYNMPYGVLAIHRRQCTDAPPWTARTILSPLTSGSGIEWAFYWRRICLMPNPQEWLGHLRPLISPRLRLTVTHSVENSALVPTNFMLAADVPFFAEAQVEASMVTIVSWFDGEKTAEEIFHEACRHNFIPMDYPINVFLNLISNFIQRGYLHLKQENIE